MQYSTDKKLLEALEFTVSRSKPRLLPSRRSSNLNSPLQVVNPKLELQVQDFLQLELI